MSLFTDASLVMVPSGIKDQKVYSIKPTDGSGDLTFSRGSNATRVNSSGLVEKVRENVSLYSEDYTNAYWTKGFVNISANSIANPVNGATTATTVTPNTSTGSHYLRSTSLAMSANTEISQSIYAKANGYNYIMLEGYDGSNNPKIIFNLSDGSFSIFSATGNPVGSVEVLANGWYRLKMTWTTQAGSPNVYQYYFVYDNGSATSYAGDGTSGAYFFGAQLEYGTTTDYIGPTAGTSVSVGPVSGLPRLDYSGGASCPSLLLEPQRTNDLQYSEQADNAYWVKEGSTISANTTATLDPSGYNGADKLQEDSSTGVHRYGKGTFASGTQRTFSVFAKKAERDYISLFENNAVSPEVKGVIFNLANGTVQTNNASSFYLNPTIVDYGNGWYRCSATWTPLSLSVPSIGVSANGTTNSYAGTTGSGIYVWGAQLEAGAYATSYIPTLSTAVTRVADVANKTGISSLLGASEGTLFVDFVMAKSGETFQSILIGNGTQRVYFYYIKTADKFGWSVVLNGTGFGDTNTTFTPTVGTRYKIALAYSNGSNALYINGTSVASNTTALGSITLSDLYFSYLGGSEKFAMPINQTLLFKTRLTNAQLAELTA